MIGVRVAWMAGMSIGFVGVSRCLRSSGLLLACTLAGSLWSGCAGEPPKIADAHVIKAVALRLAPGEYLLESAHDVQLGEIFSPDRGFVGKRIFDNSLGRCEEIS